VEWVVLTNSDHVRAAREVVAAFGAKVAGPRAEKETFPLACERWLGDDDALVPGLVAFEMHGSKTPGELALILEDTTLITGDLVRAHRANALMMLSPEQKLADRAKAAASVARLAELTRIEAVLVGDGWCVFREGAAMLRELSASLKA
jgi:glyoxylase-like metal-dependent hydrolase (beta-lactamase superfamily II)